MYILDCTEAAELCKNLQPFLNIIKVFLQILRWSVPVLLIALGSFDMFNAVTKAEDEKVLQDARRKLIKRIIYGIIVFLVPFIINLIFELIDNKIPNEDAVTSSTWISCWNDTVEGMNDCSDIYAPEKEKTPDESGSSVEEKGKTCYVWEEYTCSVKGTDYNSNNKSCIKEYELTDSILEKWYTDWWNDYGKDYVVERIKKFINQDNGAVLDENAKELCNNNLNSKPREVSYRINGSKYYTICMYGYKLEKQFSTKSPDKSADGKYTKHICKTQECSINADILCDKGTPGTTKKQ